MSKTEKIKNRKCLKCSSKLEVLSFSQVMDLKNGYEFQELRMSQKVANEINKELERLQIEVLHCTQCNRDYYREKKGDYEEKYRTVEDVLYAISHKSEKLHALIDQIKHWHSLS